MKIKKIVYTSVTIDHAISSDYTIKLKPKEHTKVQENSNLIQSQQKESYCHQKSKTEI
jgi:hypothetical protein